VFIVKRELVLGKYSRSHCPPPRFRRRRRRKIRRFKRILDVDLSETIQRVAKEITYSQSALTSYPLLLQKNCFENDTSMGEVYWRHDTWYNDIKHEDIWDYDTRQNKKM
jgi:hypothetical protein